MPDSKRQVRAAYAVKEGKSNILPGNVADEIISKMHGRSMSSLPESAGKKNPLRKKKGGFKKKSMFGGFPSDNDGDEG